MSKEENVQYSSFIVPILFESSQRNCAYLGYFLTSMQLHQLHGSEKVTSLNVRFVACEYHPMNSTIFTDLSAEYLITSFLCHL